MKTFSMTLLLLLLFAFALAAPALAETLSVQYSFDQQPNPDKFNLYQNGIKVCTAPGDSAGEFTCDVPDTPYGDTAYTLTAVSGSTESPHSPVYTLNKELATPTINLIATIRVQVGPEIK